VATTHLSNRQGHNVRQLRELQQVAGSRAAPRLLVGDLNMPSTVLLFASRRGWPETGRGRTFPNSAPTQQLDHILRNDPAGAVRPRGARVAAAPVSDHRALVEEGIPWFAACLVRRAARKLPAEHRDRSRRSGSLS
jgi:endonuclease/exonuclease/phosphatase family metal-dependent hydrolase